MARKTRAFARASAFILMLVAAAGGASAQSVGGDLAGANAGSNFTRDRNIAVRQRAHPGFEAPAHRLGAFVLQPTVVATGEYNDNIFAARSNHAQDIIGRLQPRVDLASTWSRHELTAFAQTTLNKYAKYTNEDTTDWTVGGNGRLDIIRGSNINAGIDTGRFTEPRTASSSQFLSVKPIRFHQTDGYLTGVREVNRIRLSARGDWKRFDYQDGRDTAGRAVLQDDRDRTAKALLGRADYAVSPATALFVQVAGNWRDYRLNPPQVSISRDSHGYEVLGGANFELSNVMRGELGLGYLSQTFRDSRFRDINGFGARGQIEWFPSQLTTLTGSISRTVEDSGITGSSGYLSTNASGQIDHELLRNVIITAQASYGRDAYRGIDRRDSRYGAGLSATYLLNRRLGASLAYAYFDQTSAGAAKGFDFKINRVLLTLTGHL